jgi:hypothetical protein
MDDYYEFNANSGSLILFRNRSEAEEKSAKALTHNRNIEQGFRDLYHRNKLIEIWHPEEPYLPGVSKCQYLQGFITEICFSIDFGGISFTLESAQGPVTGEVLLTDDILKELENFHGADLKVRGL